MNNKQLAKKNKFILFSGTAILLILVILGAINFISFHKFYRYDLTEDKRYSISEATKSILKNIDDRLTVKVFFSKKLPAELKTVEQQVRDMLSEFQAYTPASNMVVRFIDPAESEKLKKEVKSLGIPQVQMNVYEKNKLQVINGYLGIALFYLDKKEILPVVNNVNNLEYDLASAILRMKQKKDKVIGFLIGHKEHGIGQFVGVGTIDRSKDDYKELRKALEKNYQVRAINVEVNPSDPFKDIDALIIAGPEDEFSKRDKFEIDQYIMKGGKVIFLIDRVKINKGLSAVNIDNNLDDLLENYGFKIDKNLVLDQSSGNAVFYNGFMRFLVPYPYWVKVQAEGLNRSNPITAQLESVVLPWVSSLQKVDKEGISIEPLLQTTNQAWIVTFPYELSPQEEWDKQQDAKKQIYDLAYLVKGKFISKYKDLKEIPKLQKKNEKGDWETINIKKVDKDRDIIKEAKKENQIIIVANSRFLDDESLKRWPANKVFFQNAVDYLTLGDELINIRSKKITNRPLKELSNWQKQLVKIIGIFLVPVLSVIYAFSLFLYRKRRNKRIFKKFNK